MIEFNAREIGRLCVLIIFRTLSLQAGMAGGNAGNFSHLKFPALEIETVENGLIRQ